MKIKSCMLLLGLASVAFSSAASAGLVVVGTIDQPGFGYGAMHRDLTLQAPGSGTVESGCVGISGSGSFVVGSTACIGDALVHAGNGITNLGGNEPSPQGDNQFYGAPTIGSLGILEAAEILIGFDAVEPGAAMFNGLTVQDLTLKFYRGTELVLAIDGSATFTETFTGAGVADYFFGIDEEQQEVVNDTIFSAGDFGEIRMALEATIINAQAGAESFFLVRGASNGGPGPHPVPEPAMLGLLGLGIAGVGFARRRKA